MPSRGFMLPLLRTGVQQMSTRVADHIYIYTYYMVVVRGNGGGKKKDICARFIRCIIAAEVFSVLRNHKGSFE